MDEKKKELGAYPITFQIYAQSEQEAEEARMAIIAFIGIHARQGRAVTGAKIAKALSAWDANPIVRNRIIDFLK